MSNSNVPNENRKTRNYNSGLCWEVWPENLPFWLHKFTAGGDFVLVFNGTSVDGANSSWLAELRRGGGEGCTGECTGHTEIQRERAVHVSFWCWKLFASR